MKATIDFRGLQTWYKDMPEKLKDVVDSLDCDDYEVEITAVVHCARSKSKGWVYAVVINEDIIVRLDEVDNTYFVKMCGDIHRYTEIKEMFAEIIQCIEIFY